MSIVPVSLPDPAAALSRLAAINAALRHADPDAQVALDPDTGRMKVLTVLPADDVVRVLQALGEPAELFAVDGEDAAGDHCCGCGCKSR